MLRTAPPVVLALFLVCATTACLSDPDEVEFEGDDPTTGELAILEFDSQFESITQGPSSSGDIIQGATELSWEVEGASKIRLFANGAEIDLVDCQSAEDVDCLQDYRRDFTPTSDTTYRLQVQQDEECILDENCLREELDVQVMEPVQFSLEPKEDDRFQPGDDVIVNYGVQHAEDWELGIVDDDQLDPLCDTASDAKCRLDHPESGQLTIHEPINQTTLSPVATNGADDGLGDLAVGDVELRLFPADEPIVRDFSVEPEFAEFGTDVTLNWSTEDADSIAISAEPSGAFTDALDQCSTIDTDGNGDCTLSTIDEFDEPTDVTLIAIASDESGAESDPDAISLQLGNRPSIESFVITSPDDGVLQEGDEQVTLEWEVLDDPNTLAISANDDEILSLPDGTASDACGPDQDEPCPFVDGKLVVDDIDEPTEFILSVGNEFGDRSTSRTVNVADTPSITSLEADGTDLFQEPAIIFQPTTQLQWNTDNTDEVNLQRAEATIDDTDCSSSDLDFETISGFPKPDAQGSFDLDDLDDHVTCFRFLASEDQTDQSSTRRFAIVRGPVIDDFQVTPSQTTRGDTVVLSWETRFSDAIDITSDESDHLADNALGDCDSLDSDGHGSCEVETLSSSSASTIQFDAQTSGFDDSFSQEETANLAFGNAPEITEFCASIDGGDCEDAPVASDTSATVTLNWTFEDEESFTDWTITDASGNLVADMDDFDDDGDSTEGSLELNDVSQTTSWTLLVENQFGSNSSEVTAFFGPVVEEFEVAGSDATGGSEVSTTAGDIPISFKISGLADFNSNSDPLVDLQIGMPVNNDCDIDDVSWEEQPFTAVDTDSQPGTSTTFEGEATASNRASNFCLLVEGENDAGQTSSIRALVSTIPKRPAAPVIDTDSFVAEDGANINIDYEARFGAASVDTEVRFIDSDGSSMGDFSPIGDCSEGVDSLDQTGDIHTGTCTHSMEGESCGLSIPPCSFDPSELEDADHIEYRTCATDLDNDTTCSNVSSDTTVDVE